MPLISSVRLQAYFAFFEINAVNLMSDIRRIELFDFMLKKVIYNLMSIKNSVQK